MVAPWDQIVPARQFEQRNAFLHRATGDREEVAPVGLREAPVALGEVGRDRKGGPVELVRQEAEARKPKPRGAPFVWVMTRSARSTARR